MFQNFNDDDNLLKDDGLDNDTPVADEGEKNDDDDDLDLGKAEENDEENLIEDNMDDFEYGEEN